MIEYPGTFVAYAFGCDGEPYYCHGDALILAWWFESFAHACREARR